MEQRSGDGRFKRWQQNERRKTKIHWNIGMIIFVVILVYILINVILFLGKKKLTVYKVTEDKITNTLSFTGIAIRDEELLKASQSGYITYYVEEGKTDQEIRNGLYG